ncbi:hypothetical protein [Afifella sp. YEN Y35]
MPKARAKAIAVQADKEARSAQLFWWSSLGAIAAIALAAAISR